MRVRSTYVLLSTLLGLAGIMAAQDPQPKKPAFSIAISAPQFAVKAGSPMVLQLTLTNTTDHDLNVSHAHINGTLLRYMDVKVFDKDGQPVAETDYGMGLHGRRLWPIFGDAGTSESIKPSEAVHEESDLNKEFDLSKPGKYTVQAERMDSTVREVVKSNVITFTVTP
ncbi:MAG: hypothetical protein ACLQKA_18630 [Bryobacteraceae bacterium]